MKKIAICLCFSAVAKKGSACYYNIGIEYTSFPAEVIMFIQVHPVIDHTVRKLCCSPYPGHDKGKNIGCPNFNKREGCPPKAPLFDKVFNLNEPVYAVYNLFDLNAHVHKMKAAHPNWSEAQLRCCLLWQGRARKQLAKNVADFIMAHPLYDVSMAHYRGIEKDLGPLYGKIIAASPEAMGVNVTETLASAGISLEWPPTKVAYQVALAGIKKS